MLSNCRIDLNFKTAFKEKLFHLDGGETLLDFGCGAGELLVHYAPKYEKMVGVDFSASMLDEASTKVSERKCGNISLILADDKTVWDNLESSFYRITAAGVIQYLTLQEIDSFIFNASNYLNKGGKIVLFDILDPRLYPLWKIELFSQDADFGKILRKIGFEFRILGLPTVPTQLEKLQTNTVLKLLLYNQCIMNTNIMQ